MTRLVLDSWTWLEIFLKGPKAKTVLKCISEADEVLTTAANAYEVLYRVAEDAGGKIAEERRQFIQNSARIISIDLEIATIAAGLHKTANLPAVDAFTLAAARLNNAKVLTGDPHFKGIKDAILL